jgi:hypothetical protein
MPLDVALITDSFKGNAVPPNGCVPGSGDGAEFAPVVAAAACMMLGTLPGVVAMGRISAAPKSFVSWDPLPNVVFGDAVVVPVLPVAELPDDELEITVVAGASPPPPPPQAARTNTLAAAAKRRLLRIFSPRVSLHRPNEKTTTLKTKAERREESVTILSSLTTAACTGANGVCIVLTNVVERRAARSTAHRR